MLNKKYSIHLTNILLFITFTVSSSAYAINSDYHFSCFDISLPNNLKLISKTEEKENGFYRYVFSSSNNDDAPLQMRIIVSSKKPEAGQSVEAFQIASIGAMSAMFMDSYKLYQYLETPENQKVLKEKPYELKRGNASFAGATMYFGNTDASFLITRSDDMTYAFTLVSRNKNELSREGSLKALMEQLKSLTLHSCS